jgi:predicted nucleic acid-binding Zn ribbon protein
MQSACVTLRNATNKRNFTIIIFVIFIVVTIMGRLNVGVLGY